MGANTANAMLFLVTTLFDLALWIYLLRVLLQWSRADFYNPISQAIWKATRYPGDWLRPHLPNWRNLNIAAVLMLVALAVIYIYVEIGRASCRERVGLYVSISVVADPLKKKNK